MCISNLTCRQCPRLQHHNLHVDLQSWSIMLCKCISKFIVLCPALCIFMASKFICKFAWVHSPCSQSLGLPVYPQFHSTMATKWIFQHSEPWPPSSPDLILSVPPWHPSIPPTKYIVKYTQSPSMYILKLLLSSHPNASVHSLVHFWSCSSSILSQSR